MSRLRRREEVAAYVFLSPYIVSTIVFTAGLLFFALYISLHSWNLFTTPKFVGLANYIRSFSPTSPQFLHGLLNVFWYSLFVVFFQTAVAMMFAVLLNKPMRRGGQFFRTFFYAPSVVSSVVTSMLFWWMYLKTGFVNLLFAKVAGLFGGHWTSVDWLNAPQGLIQMIAGLFGAHISLESWYATGPSITLMALMFQNIYTTAPTFMIMFLAALQDIPASLYESAAIDGATAWTRFWRITLPLVRPAMVLVVVLGTIGTLQLFDQVKIMTAGGPLGTTLVPVYLIYRETLGTEGPIRAGYGAAMGFVLAAIIFVFTYIQRKAIEHGTEQYF